jgi:DNA-binding CsgD family transcriptional regulator
MHAGSDTDALVEVATAAVNTREYEQGVLETLRRRLGFDVAMFKRRDSCGTHGLDPNVELACRPRWDQFRLDALPVTRAALTQRGVAVDIDVLGLRRMQRLSYYQDLMRPHRGTSTALMTLTRGGQPLATLALGRTHGSFSDPELAYLRSVVPAISVCEAALQATPPPLEPRSELSQLTQREREVLAYLPLGYTNAQIALALGTAQRTVRNQLSSIYEKLGVASRAEAVARCSHGR